MKDMCVTIMSRIYGCYRWFAYPSLLTIILRSDPMIVATLDKDIINITFFNHCGQKLINTTKVHFYK